LLAPRSIALRNDARLLPVPPTGMLRITEIFHSIQGESSHVGRPCVFVRLTGCNLRCTWCDSVYTFTGGEKMSLGAVMDQVRSYGCNLVEVTGGEPLAQAESLDLIKALCDEYFEVLIETSGSIDVTPVDRRAKLILDVKCPGSGEAEKNRWENLHNLREHDEIKFVLADRADYEFAREVISRERLGKRHILLSPVWGSLDLKSLAEWILEDRLPARLQTQLHKHIWGPDVTGV
jgi:7-carboxy-7-deazaguanine synthase